MTSDVYDINVDLNGNLILNPRDDRKTAFWMIANAWMIGKYNLVIDAMAFGKDSKSYPVFKVIQELSLFLDGLYQRIQLDMGDGRAYMGDIYYYNIYCIPKMKKRLLCMGLPSKLIDDLFSIYFGGVTTVTPSQQLDGIGYMIISDTFIIA